MNNLQATWMLICEFLFRCVYKAILAFKKSRRRLQGSLLLDRVFSMWDMPVYLT